MISRQQSVPFATGHTLLPARVLLGQPARLIQTTAMTAVPRSYLTLLVAWSCLAVASSQPLPSFVLEEGRPANTLVVDLSVHLADLIANAPNCSKQTCKFNLASADPSVLQYFYLNVSSGRLTTKRVLDREALISTLDPVVFRVDFLLTPGLSTGSFQVPIGDVNDNAPRFADRVEELAISEASLPNQKRPILAAIDQDAGPNGTLTYAIESGNTGDTFELRTDDNGFPYLTTAKSLDRETTPHYCLNVSAHDNGSAVQLWGWHIVNITLLDTNDNRPVFGQTTYTVKLQENAPRETELIQLNATDPDAGSNGRISYKIETVFGETERHFVINNETGLISTTSMSFDLEKETTPRYSFFVEARDTPSATGENALASQVTVYVDIEDMNDEEPVATVRPASIVISETYTVGVSVAQVSLSDPDKGSARGSFVRSSMEGCEGLFNYTEPPSLSGTGQIIVAKVLDYESRNSCVLTLTAVDEGVPPLSSTTVIPVKITDFNDNPPHFISQAYNTHIAENEPIGSLLVKVKADDKDTGIKAQLKYAIKDIYPKSAGAFSINETGWLKTASVLDRELTPSVLVVVSATDGKYVTNANVTVTIDDVNDNAPAFQKDRYEFVVHEGEMNTEVGSVKAVDVDQGQSGEIQYSIENADSVPFSIHEESGVISTKGALDYEIHHEYNITVIAQDKGSSSESATIVVNIKVADKNDNPPRFAVLKGAYVAKVQTAVDIGKTILTVTALDPDTGSGGELSYHLVPGEGSPTNWFTINKNGAITVAQIIQLTDVKVKNFSYIIRVEDNGVSPLSSNAELVVEVTNTGAVSGSTDSPQNTGSDFGLILIILVVALVVLMVILMFAVMLFFFRRKARDWVYDKDAEKGKPTLQATKRKSSSRVQFAVEDLVVVNEYDESKEPMTPRYDPEGENSVEKKTESVPNPAGLPGAESLSYCGNGIRSRMPIQEKESAVIEKDAGEESDSDSASGSGDSGHATCDSVVTPSVSSTKGLLPSTSSGRHESNGTLSTPL